MATIRLLKSFLNRKFLCYILITIIPSVAISFMLAKQQEIDVDSQYQNKAKWYANYHALNIENFLGETVGRLEMLATSIKVQHKELPEIETILKETQEKDERFSGFYWANTKGDLLVSTNPTSSTINFGGSTYFQEALKTKKTTISEAHIGKVTGRNVITVVTPIVENGNIGGVLLASLRFDKIESTIRKLLKDEMIIVTDNQKQTLMKAGIFESETNLVKSSTDITKEPWTITAVIHSKDQTDIWESFIKYFVVFLAISNILFLWTKYLILQKNIKKQKEQAEVHKLELIGNMAASTAHEIRNPLTGIKGLVKLLSEEYKDEKAQAYFNVIQTELDRINAIVSELLVLGKPTAYTLQSYDANEIVSEIEPIIHSETNYMNVGLNIEYFGEKLAVSCVKDHLKQVILNLAKNSLQAMPHGGTLSISLDKRASTCLIRVADTGVGMKEEQAKQVFKPFYTLKKDGSGLGLTVCKRIIDTYGGNISIQSELNKGTMVEISLPLSVESNTN